MKYCINCYNSMPDEYAFCPRCGANQGGELKPIASFDKYANLSIKGVYHNTLELTPQGVHIFGSWSVFRKAYDKMIPYDEIISIELTKSSLLSNGLLSIITHEAGLSGLKPPFSMKDTSIISEDQNTIMFHSKYKKIAQEIYEAINEICLRGFAFNTTYDVENDMDSIVFQNYDLDFDSMDGHEFELFCADVLKKNGYSNIEITKTSGDQGIDIIAYKNHIKYGIQCKCYTSDVGNKAVQEVFAGKAFYQCHLGIVLTNRYFTKSAIELADKNGIILWDRNRLLEMIEASQKNDE